MFVSTDHVVVEVLQFGAAGEGGDGPIIPQYFGYGTMVLTWSLWP